MCYGNDIIIVPLPGNNAKTLELANDAPTKGVCINDTGSKIAYKSGEITFLRALADGKVLQEIPVGGQYYENVPLEFSPGGSLLLLASAQVLDLTTSSPEGSAAGDDELLRYAWPTMVFPRVGKENSS